MNTLLPAASRGIACTILLLLSVAAAAAELKVMSAVGVQEVMEDLGRCLSK
jgi:hypothetical protein